MSKQPAYAHEAEFIRDVPWSCICPWEWSAVDLRWKRVRYRWGCPWHSLAGGTR